MTAPKSRRFSTRNSMRESCIDVHVSAIVFHAAITKSRRG